MTLSIRATFDGRVFVPEEPVSLPVNQPVTVQADVPAGGQSPAADVTARDEALLRFLANPRNGKGLPDWAMGREYLYDDRD